MDRLISEFEVIRAIEKYVDNIFTKNMGDLINDVKAIPSAEPSRDMEEIEEIINCDADAETKCKMISNILTAKPHYFEEQEPKRGHCENCDTCSKNHCGDALCFGNNYCNWQPKQAIPSAEPTLDSIRESIEEYVCNVETDTARAQKMLNAWRAIEYDEPLPSADKWIPVSERLPEWDIECLVVDDKGEFGVGFYRDDVGAWDSPSWGWLERKDDVDNHDAYYMPCGIGKVVAWMPLPAPYEPQERSDDENDFEKRIVITTESMDLGYDEIMDIGYGEIPTIIEADKEKVR